MKRTEMLRKFYTYPYDYRFMRWVLNHERGTHGIRFRTRMFAVEKKQHGKIWRKLTWYGKKAGL